LPTGSAFADAASAAASASASASLVAERARVEAGYRAYWKVAETMLASGTVDMKAWNRVATPEQAQQDGQNASGLFSAGSRQVGHVGVTVRTIKITGDTAQVQACLDGTHWVSIPMASASPEPGKTGQGVGAAQATMKRSSSGAWLLATRAADKSFTC
jgi:hypothetical protein